MRTRTIFEAYDRTYRGLDWIIPPKRARQNDKFRAELLRRMDERDAMALKTEVLDVFYLWVEGDQGIRERGLYEWVEMFTAWVGYAYPDAWPWAKPPYERPQWCIDIEKKERKREEAK